MLEAISSRQFPQVQKERISFNVYQYALISFCYNQCVLSVDELNELSLLCFLILAGIETMAFSNFMGKICSDRDFTLKSILKYIAH